MTATLTDRYVHAATRTVPEKQRADLATELRGSIEDQIDGRLEQGQPRDRAEHEVLTALGDPDKLAAGYTDRPLQLIGPRYYLQWWRLLKLLWAIVPVCAAFGVALAMTLAGEPIGGIIGTIAATTVSVIVHVGFWTTFVFFLVERYGSEANEKLAGEWSLDDLPQAPERRASLGELIASLSFLALAVGAVLWDSSLGFVYFAGEGWIPFLNQGLWPWGIAVLFTLIALEALHAVWLYARGGWTRAAAVVNVVLNLAIAVPALVLLAQQQLLNPDFFPSVIRNGTGSGETVQTIVTTLFAFGIVLIAVWDSIDGVVKARRAGRE